MDKKFLFPAMKDFFNKNPLAMIIWKEDVLVQFNKEALNILPFIEELENQNWENFKAVLAQSSVKENLDDFLLSNEKKPPIKNQKITFKWNDKNYDLLVSALHIQNENKEKLSCFILQKYNNNSQDRSFSGKLYNSFIENTEDLIFLIDIEGRILYSNNSVKQLFGFKPIDILGQSISFITDAPHTRPFFIDQVLFSQRNTFLIQKDIGFGQSLHLSLNCILIEQAQEAEPIILIIGRDITEIIQYQKMLLKNIREQDIQKESLEIFLQSKTFEEAFHKLFKKLTIDLKIKGTSLISNGKNIISEGKKSIYFLDYPFSSAIDNKDYLFRIFLEKREKNSNLPLSRILFYTFSNLFNTMERFKIIEIFKESKEIAEESDRLKSQFMANISHEIKTPLNGILGFLQLLEQTPLSADQKDYIHTISQSGKRLLMLLNDLVDLARIESGQDSLVSELIRTENLFKTIFDQFSMKVKKKGLLLNIKKNNIPKEIFSDPDKIRLIFKNILDNALKFTNKGSIEISINYENEKFGCMVKDSGIGIPIEKQKLIFKKFVQVDGSFTRQYGGTGLGLSIVSAILEIMKGEIRVESTPLKGSSFFFSFPTPLTQ